MPSLSAALWLAIFLGLACSPLRTKFISADGDPCLHRRIGQWMIDRQQIIRADQFSHTRPGAALISKEWLSEIVLAAAADALDWNGVVLIAAALAASCFWLLHRQLLREGTDLLAATGLVLLAALAVSPTWVARPQLVTHLLTVIFAWQLREFDRDRLPARQLWMRLVPLMALWTNLHGAFFTGLVLIGIYFAGACLDWVAAPAEQQEKVRLRAALLAGLWLSCLAASLLNPNGWQLHAHILEFLRTPTLTRLVEEFRAADFHRPGLQGFCLQLLLLGILLLWVRPLIRRTDLLLIAVWGYFSLYSSRNVAIFSLVVIPILAEHLTAAVRPSGGPWLVDRFRSISSKITAIDASAGGRRLVAVAVLGLVAAAIIRRPGGGPILRTAIDTNRFPVQAVRYLQVNPGAVRGEMFNSYVWGGYLMLAMPERKVFIDGRNDFYGKDLVEDFQTIDDLKPDWDAVLKRYRVGWTLLPADHPLHVLLQPPEWKRVYQDHLAAVYVRQPVR